MTRSHLEIGRLARIPIGLNLSWILIFGLVVWTLGAAYFPQVAEGAPPEAVWVASVAASLLFFASILAHELGHALTAQAHGIPVRSITLFALGGVSRIESEPRTPGEEFLIALMGPAVSLGLALAFWGAAGLSALSGSSGELPGLPGSGLWNASLTYLAVVNGALALFNLIPALPLDGGRVLRALLWLATGDPGKATRGAAVAGRTFGGLLVGLGLASGAFGGILAGFWLVMVGVFVERSARSAALATRQEVEAIPSAAARPAAARLRTATSSASTEGEEVVLAKKRKFDAFAERVTEWRARLDMLPPPEELFDEIDGEQPDSEIVRRCQADRSEMARIVERLDAQIQAGTGNPNNEEPFDRLQELFDRWRSDQSSGAPPEEQEEEASMVSGRPESFAPSPEEVLFREPGSSAEV